MPLQPRSKKAKKRRNARIQREAAATMFLPIEVELRIAADVEAFIEGTPEQPGLSGAADEEALVVILAALE